MAKTTFWDVIEKTIEKVGTPLSAKEIWDKANELGTLGDFSTTGKTPWATIAAYCYTDINNNAENSMIIQTSENANFNDFLKLITEDCKLGKVKSQYDKVLKMVELTKYIHDKGIN